MKEYTVRSPGENELHPPMGIGFYKCLPNGWDERNGSSPPATVDKSTLRSLTCCCGNKSKWTTSTSTRKPAKMESFPLEDTKTLMSFD